jgi:CheY-like chemotaxis protein
VTVVLTPSALEAWRILSGHGPSIRAIVTDLNMPRMDGFELIRRVRADGRLAAMPIVVVSADTDPGDSPADRATGGGRVLRQAFLTRRGTAETGADSQWYDRLIEPAGGADPLVRGRPPGRPVHS